MRKAVVVGLMVVMLTCTGMATAEEIWDVRSFGYYSAGGGWEDWTLDVPSSDSTFHYEIHGENLTLIVKDGDETVLLERDHNPDDGGNITGTLNVTGDYITVEVHNTLDTMQQLVVFLRMEDNTPKKDYDYVDASTVLADRDLLEGTYGDWNLVVPFQNSILNYEVWCENATIIVMDEDGTVLLERVIIPPGVTAVSDILDVTGDYISVEIHNNLDTVQYIHVYLKVEERTPDTNGNGDGDGDDAPGFGLAIVVVAMLLAMTLCDTCKHFKRRGDRAQ